MNKPQMTHKIAALLAPFIGIAIFILLVVVGFIFFSYLLIIGALLFLILFCVFYLRAKFFAYKTKKQGKQQTQHSHQGRTIDHDLDSRDL